MKILGINTSPRELSNVKIALEAALDAAIKFYDSEKSYDKISELLKTIGDEALNEKYSKYFVDAPVIDTKD